MSYLDLNVAADSDLIKLRRYLSFNAMLIKGLLCSSTLVVVCNSLWISLVPIVLP